MIKFFRKIRQNLLSEGKTGKYFKYAIGEIILVVIGILIALQINNWNEQTKSREFEIFTLKEVKNNLKNDSVQIQRILEKSRFTAKSLQNLSKIDSESMDSMQLAIEIQNIWGFDRFFPNRNGYEALKSRGFQISNPNLRNVLGKYYENDLAKVSASIRDIETAFVNDFNPIVRKGYFRINHKLKTLEIINRNNQNFQNDIMEYINVLSPNHSATVISIEEFSKINKRALNILNSSLNELN